ncbi:MAG: imelysin family protein [Bacteroidota bacterium]
MGKIRIVFGVVLLVLVGACSEKSKEKTFNVDLFLKEITKNVILPTLNDFKNEAELLSKETATYAKAPNLDQLEKLKKQWIKTAYAYERTYNFHFGPAKSRFLHRAIYNWPTVPETIENLLVSNEINEQTMAKASPQIKGLAALEYLLFKEDSATLNKEMIEYEQRRTYLLEGAKFLEAQANRLVAIWAPGGENYAATFVANKATGINNPFNLLFNGLYNAANTAKVTKIGKPGGLEKSPRTNPQKVQAPYSHESLALTLASVAVIEEVFFSTDHPNISQYLSSVSEDELTNQRIKTAIDEIKDAIKAIPVPLQEAVDTYPEEVENLHLKLTALNIWMGVDARSMLSVIITSTDNDGD